jgi:hypothetical protein
MVDLTIAEKYMDVLVKIIRQNELPVMIDNLVLNLL